MKKNEPANRAGGRPAFRVVRPHRSEYPDPLRAPEGTGLRFERRSSPWPGWIWCEDETGRAGWTPESWVEIRGDRCVLRRDYDAAELDVDPGDRLAGVEEESGWLLAITPDGRSGWVPLDRLEPDHSAR